MPKKKADLKNAQNCSACAELGNRFHYSFPEDQSVPDPAAFAHLCKVADSIISFRDELVRCDTCHTYFAWNRMWDNDVYSTPLDYVDIHRLTDAEADAWLKREKDWARKERAAERREIRKLKKLWADVVSELPDDERTIFEYLVQAHSKGRSGEMLEKECGLPAVAMWQALEFLQQKKIVRRTTLTINWPKEHAQYEISSWR